MEKRNLEKQSFIIYYLFQSQVKNKGISLQVSLGLTDRYRYTL